MDNKARSILLVFLSSIFVAFAQLGWKIGAANLSLSFMSVIINLPLIAGFVLYAIGAVLLIYSLKTADLSLVYPIYSAAYIWVTLLSYFVLQEAVPALRWLGVVVIVAGVVVISKG